MITTTELVDKVFAFCEFLSNKKLFPYQAQFAKRVIRSVVDNEGETISALWSRQSGKTESIAVVVSGMAVLLPILANMPMFADERKLQLFKNGFLCGIFAPAMHQAQICFSRVKDNLAKPATLDILSSDEFNVSFATNNGQNIVLKFNNLNIYSEITCMSASENSNIEGKSFMLIIIDESQDVSNYKYGRSISPMAAFYNGTKVIIGTPTTQRNFLFDTIEMNKRDEQVGDRKKNHFEYNYKTVVKYNPNYGKYIEGEKKRLGFESDEFQMSYNLKWLFERGMFVDPDTFEKLGDIDAERIISDHKDLYVAGIDLGKANDSTVVTILWVDWENPVIIEKAKDSENEDFVVYNTRIVDWMEIQGDNWNEQYAQLVSYLSNFRIERAVIDATGVGNPIYDRLAAVSSFEVIPYVFSTQSKSALFKHLDSQIKSGRTSYPAGEETRQTREYQHFVEQMLEAEKSYTGQHMVVSAPNLRNKHDDYPVSYSLAEWAARGEATKPTTENGNPFFQKQTTFYYRKRNNLTAKRM